MSSSNSPCAACKCRRQKCTQECVFAPYFPPDQPQKFINIHNVFGASNIGKILNELSVSQREEAVNSLAYEAECRLRDPVYGCVGHISYYQHRLKQVQQELFNAKKELATYIGSTEIPPVLQPGFIQQHPNNPSSSAAMPHNMQPMMALPTGVAAAHVGQLMIRDPQQQQQQQQQMFDPQQMVAVIATSAQQEILSYEQQQAPQQQNELLRFNSGFDNVGPAINQMPIATMSPSLALGSYKSVPYHQIQQAQQPPPPQAQLQQPQLHRANSEEVKSIGPSS